jgi:hypothetical protein
VNDNLYYWHCKKNNPYIPGEDLWMCQNPYVYHWKIKEEPDLTKYEYANQNRDFDVVKNISIYHNANPTPLSINTAIYLNQFNRLSSVWPQNSFFTPITLRDTNGYVQYIFFSVGGSLQRRVMEDNFMHRINLTTFDFLSSLSNIKYDYVSKSLFPNTRTGINQQIPNAEDYFLFTALYDYAAILVNFEGNNYLLIHGECASYYSRTKSQLLQILITETIEYQYYFIATTTSLA